MGDAEREYDYAFFRTEERKSARIRDSWETYCGHQIDRSEPYRYTVFKLNCDKEITQMVDCEPCARRDKADWR